MELTGSPGNKVSALAALMLGEIWIPTTSPAKVRLREDTTLRPSISSRSITTLPLSISIPLLNSMATNPLSPIIRTRTRVTKLHLSNMEVTKGDTTLISTMVNSSSMAKDRLVGMGDPLSTADSRDMTRDHHKGNGAKDKEVTNTISLLATTIAAGGVIPAGPDEGLDREIGSSNSIRMM